MSGIIIIRSIKINNILSHEQTYIEFPLGLSALVGPNGAGKSSIIDSIFYALFATPQSIRSLRGTSKRSILRIGAQSGSIEVELSVGGKRYVIYRSISVNRSDEAVVYEILDGDKRRVVASGVQPVLEYVKQLLSIPSAEAIRYTIFSRQNEVSKLIEEQPSTRKEIVLKLLGLDELEKAKEFLKQHLDQANSDKRVYEQYKIDLDNMRKKISEIRKAIELSKYELSKAEEEVKQLEEDIKNTEKILELVKKYEVLSRAVKIANEAKELEKILPICREIIQIDVSEYTTIVNILKNRKRELDEAMHKLKYIDDRIKSIASDVSKELGLEIPLEDSTKIIDILEEFARNIDRERNLKSAEVDIATKSVDIVKNSTSCPLCGRVLSDDLKKKILVNMEQKVETSITDIKRLEQLYDRIKKYIDDLKKLDRSKVEIMASINSAKRVIEENMEKFRELKTRVDKVIELAKNVEAFSECFKENTPISTTLRCLNRLAIEFSKMFEERSRLVKQLVGEDVSLNRLECMYQEIVEQLKSMNLDVDRINVAEIESGYKARQERLRRARERLGNLRGRIEGYTKTLEEYTKSERELEEKLKSLKVSIDLQPVLDILVNKILGKDGLLAKLLTLEARRLMEKYANMVLKELGVDFKVKITEGFDIEIHTPLGELDVRSLSGGEMVSLAIALRIALAYTVFGRLPGFFILDEPTQFLDIERRRAVFEIIRRLSERVPQVIVVTHDQEVEDLADKVFYVSKEGRRSVVREKEKVIETLFKA